MARATRSSAQKTLDATALVGGLRRAHPNPRCELSFETPAQLLFATILSAQCTDERVNQVTRGLWRKYPDIAALARADIEELEQDIRPTGFFRNKARSLKGAAQALVERFSSEVPRTMEALVTLPGVARKTANVVLGTAYGIASGIVVDTHVARVARRLGLTRAGSPEQIEKDLQAIVPREEWIFVSHAMVLHGRYVCTARAPDCASCVFDRVCPKVGLDAPSARRATRRSARTRAPAPPGR